MEQVPPDSKKMAKFTGSANTLEIAGGNYHFLGGYYNFWGAISPMRVRLSFISD